MRSVLKSKICSPSDKPQAPFLLIPSAGEEAGTAVKGSLDTQAYQTEDSSPHQASCVLGRYIGRMAASTSQGCGVGAGVLGRAGETKEWRHRAISIFNDFHTKKRFPKRDTSPHGKGDDDARRVRGSLSCTSYLGASWSVALQDSQHVSDDMRVHSRSFYPVSPCTHDRRQCQDSERVVLRRQVSTPHRPKASSVLRLHEVGLVRLSSSQDHG